MSIEAHVVSLEERHANLEALIDDENQRPAPDSLRLSTWKKEKLRIKEELERLTH